MPTNVAVTNRYEHMREGVQESEARIVVERAATDETMKAKLGPELVARCQKALLAQMRAAQMCRGAGQKIIHCLSDRTDLEANWFMSSGWEQRAEAIFILAGEVEGKAGASPNP